MCVLRERCPILVACITTTEDGTYLTPFPLVRNKLHRINETLPDHTHTVRGGTESMEQV